VLEGVGVLVVGDGVDVVAVVSVFFASIVVVVSSADVVVVAAPSPSAASAAEIGPRLAAVMPLPATAETSARHSHRRAPVGGVMRRS
jgi:hypothetical protein